MSLVFSSVVVFFVAVFEMMKLFVTFTGATAGPSVFSYWGGSKTNTPYLCLFLCVCSGYGSLVCVVRRISRSVWFSVCGSASRCVCVCSCHRLQSGFKRWYSELVHSTRCYIPFVVVFSVCIKDAHLSPSQTTRFEYQLFQCSKRFHKQVRPFPTNIALSGEAGVSFFNNSRGVFLLLVLHSFLWWNFSGLHCFFIEMVK